MGQVLISNFVITSTGGIRIVYQSGLYYMASPPTEFYLDMMRLGVIKIDKYGIQQSNTYTDHYHPGDGISADPSKYVQLAISNTGHVYTNISCTSYPAWVTDIRNGWADYDPIQEAVIQGTRAPASGYVNVFDY
jgi:hypothetical protein